MTTIRTRIAPSPTGDPHVGTAYIALFNYCFAKSNGGEFILRIEDTDQSRSSIESEQKIFNSLKWLGLNWSEGPDIGGQYGPYRQSERKHIYQEYAQQLIDKGHAFYCFATSEELDSMREQQLALKETPRYDGRGLLLSKEEVQSKLDAGMPYVIRMKIPAEGSCVIPDLLRGDVSIDWSLMDMQVLMKADGLPTYFLANVVDDHLMKITHVIRGDEWLASAPKIVLLYQYFGWDLPVFCHMPLLRNPDKSKLSKRKNPTSIDFYKSMGYMPEAMLNYLGRMGWSMPNEEEKFTLQEMVDQFDLTRVSLGGPVFDVEKLSWLNGQWIRDLSSHSFADQVRTWAFNQDKINQLIPLVQGRVEKFSDIEPLIGFMFSGAISLDLQVLNEVKWLKEDPENVKKFLQLILWKLESLRDWNKDNILNYIKQVADAMGVKLKLVMPFLFVAISGKLNSISVIDSMEILGPDMTRFRVRNLVKALGELSKDEIKELDKFYRTIN